MKISDISHVSVDWMNGYGNDPHTTFVLKLGKKIAPREDFRYRLIDRTFFAEYENEVHFLQHDRGDHNGFGWARFKLTMQDGFSVADSGWRDCGSVQRDWGQPGHYKRADCHYCASDNSIHLVGPWSSNESYVSKVFGVECISIATLEGDRRNSIENPRWHQRMQRQGRSFEGTAFSTSYTLGFAREVIDTLCPWLELWRGDFGWTVKYRDMPPKNPLRLAAPPQHPILARDQLSAFC